MTVQSLQLQPQPCLFGDSAIQTQPKTAFSQYLEEEQQRLAKLFSAFGQFSAWFGYPDFSLGNNPAQATDFFTSLDANPPQTMTNSSNPAPALNTQTNSAVNQATTLPQSSEGYFAKSPQVLLQDILLKTGWLTPNLEASAQFNLAQLEGKLLSKLDLQFLVDQIVSQVKLVKEKGKLELSLGLKPENLGEILLTLTLHSGMIAIQIEATAQTKKLLESELSKLELALKKAKLNIAEIKVLDIKEVADHV